MGKLEDREVVLRFTTCEVVALMLQDPVWTALIVSSTTGVVHVSHCMVCGAGSI